MSSNSYTHLIVLIYGYGHSDNEFDRNFVCSQINSFENLSSSDRLLIVGAFENWFDENGRLTEYLLLDRKNNNSIHCESIENPLQIDCLIFINDNEKNQQNSPFSKQQYLETFQNQLNSFKIKFKERNVLILNDFFDENEILKSFNQNSTTTKNIQNKIILIEKNNENENIIDDFSLKLKLIYGQPISISFFQNNSNLKLNNFKVTNIIYMF